MLLNAIRSSQSTHTNFLLVFQDFVYIPKTTWSPVHGVQDVRLFNNKQFPPQQLIFNGLSMKIFLKYCIFIFLFHFLKNR